MKKVWFVSAVVTGILVSVPVAHASWFANLVAQMVENADAKHEVSTALACAMPVDEAYARSIELLSDGRQAEAQNLIDSALKTYPDNEQIMFAKAVLKRSRWGISAAHVWFRIVKRSARNEYLGQASELALALDAHKNVNANMQALIRLSDEHPDDVYLLWLSAIQCREQEKPKLGQQRYELLLKKFRVGPVMVHHTYANILTEDLKLYDLAVQHRMLAISMEQTEWSLQGLGNTLDSKGDFAWANAVWARINRAYPDNTAYLHQWGRALRGIDRPAEAAEKFEMALKLDPKDSNDWELLGRCYRDMGNKAEMLRCYEKGLALGDFSLSDDIGWSYEYGVGVDKNIDKAFEMYRQGATKSQSPNARWRLAECYGLGKGTEVNRPLAIKYYEEALSLDPDNVAAMTSYAKMLTSNRDQSVHDYPYAIKLAKMAASLAPSVDDLRTLCLAYEKNGQIDDAISTQKRLIKFLKDRNPEDPYIHSAELRLERLEKALRRTTEYF